ncbi:MAG: hypothetical protein ACYC67_11910 [Prosthecobacter sp.]|jgi:hypothetical protein
MNSMPNHRTEDRFEITSQIAHHLWRKAGCPPVADLNLWQQAEKRFFDNHNGQSTAKAKAADAARPATASSGKRLVKSQPKSAKQHAKSR